MSSKNSLGVLYPEERIETSPHTDRYLLDGCYTPENDSKKAMPDGPSMAGSPILFKLFLVKNKLSMSKLRIFSFL